MGAKKTRFCVDMKYADMRMSIVYKYVHCIELCLFTKKSDILALAKFIRCALVKQSEINVFY